MSTVRSVLQLPARLFEAFAIRILMLSGVTRQYGTVRVSVVTSDPVVRERLFRHVSDAFTLLTRYDPKSALRVRAHLRRVLVYEWPTAYGSIARYTPWFALCQVNAAALAAMAEGAGVIVACCLVHETTHARLYRRNRRTLAGGEALRLRVERLCLMTELAFVSKLPASAGLQEQLRQELDEIPQTYSDAEIKRRRPSATR
jgi:hypothetical protein